MPSATVALVRPCPAPTRGYGVSVVSKMGDRGEVAQGLDMNRALKLVGALECWGCQLLGAWRYSMLAVFGEGFWGGLVGFLGFLGAYIGMGHRMMIPRNAEGSHT